MGQGEDFRPFRYVIGNFHHRKFHQHRFQNADNILLAHLVTVYRNDADPILLLEAGRQGFRLIFIRLFGIQHHHVRLALSLQLPDSAQLALLIIFSGNFPKRAVCGHQDANGCMVADYLLRAEIRRFGERHFHIRPGGFHQPFSVIFRAAHRVGNQKTDAVDQPQLHTHILRQ